MAETDEILTTDVDSLIKLITEKKEVSIEDAAKKLNLPEVTIEAWANFLEEEGLLEIKFKFTKPFLIYKEKKGDEAATKRSAAKPLPLKAEIIEEEMKQKEETEELPDDDIPEVLKKRGFGKEKVKKAVKKPEEIKAPEPQEAIAAQQSEDTTKLDDINQLIAKAYGEMKEGKFDSARRLYEEVKTRYDQLPKRYEDEKDQLIDNLVLLSKKLAISIDVFNEKEFNISSRKIAELISKTNTLIKRRDFKLADENFKQIKEAYKQLPRGFIERKALIHDNILRLHEILVDSKTAYYLTEIKNKAGRINELLENAAKAMEKEDIETAEKLYNQIIEIQKTLPEGFLQRKIEVTERVLHFHEELCEFKAEVSISEVKVKHRLIESLIKRAYSHISHQDIDGAVELYKTAKDVHSTLPKGFLEIKSNLQKELFKIDKLLLTIKIKSSSNDFATKKAKIVKLLSLASAYIKKEEPDLAATIYDEILNIYNTLPSGYLEEKTKLKTQMLEVYEKSVLASDEMFLKGVDEKVKNRYEELLTILVQAHRNIEQGNFNALIKIQEYANKLYEELPFGFIKKKLKILDEIKKLDKQVKLWQLSQELKAISPSNTNKARSLLKDIYVLHDQLIKESPEDKNLLNYVKGVSAPYTISLIEKGKVEGRLGRRLKEMDLHVKEKEAKSEIERQHALRDIEEKKRKLRIAMMKDEKLELRREVITERKNAKEAEEQMLKEREELLHEQEHIKSKKAKAQENIKLIREEIRKADDEKKRLEAEEKRLESEEKLEQIAKAKRSELEEKRRIVEEKRMQREQERMKRLEELKIIKEERYKTLEEKRIKRLDEKRREQEELRIKKEEKARKEAEERIKEKMEASQKHSEQKTIKKTKPLFHFLRREKKYKQELEGLLKSREIGFTPHTVKEEHELENKAFARPIAHGQVEDNSNLIGDEEIVMPETTLQETIPEVKPALKQEKKMKKEEKEHKQEISKKETSRVNKDKLHKQPKQVKEKKPEAPKRSFIEKTQDEIEEKLRLLDMGVIVTQKKSK